LLEEKHVDKGIRVLKKLLRKKRKAGGLERCGIPISVEVREIKSLNRGGRGANAAVFAEGSFDFASPSLREADARSG
jgi:hypothetical protein